MYAIGKYRNFQREKDKQNLTFLRIKKDTRKEHNCLVWTMEFNQSGKDKCSQAKWLLTMKLQSVF